MYKRDNGVKKEYSRQRSKKVSTGQRNKKVYTGQRIKNRHVQGDGVKRYMETE